MDAPVTPPTVPPYHHTPLFPLGHDKTPYRKLDIGGVTIEKVMGKDMLVVSHEALRALSEAAFTDINHLLRPAHLKQLRKILDDPEASDNDKFVAYRFSEKRQHLRRRGAADVPGHRHRHHHGQKGTHGVHRGR